MPNLNDNPKIAFGHSTKNQPRPMLRGEIIDEFGKGECVLTRNEHRGFTEYVEFIAGESGIIAGNFIAAAQDHDSDEADQPVQRMLEYRYSVIPDKGCSAEYLKISIKAVDLELCQISFALSWRGAGSAKICMPDDESASGSDYNLIYRELRQNKVMELDPVREKSPEWHIKVPTHSLTISIWINGIPAEKIAGSVLVVTDAVFLQKDKVQKPLKPGISQSGTGRIQPEEVRDLIDEVERTSEPVSAPDGQSDGTQLSESDTGEKSSSSKNGLVYDDRNFETYSPSPTNIDVVLCQKIMLYRGEDIILSTCGLFADKIKTNVSYVSANLPEWIFLDQRSGDLMGTVPTRPNDADQIEFSIYAVDVAGNSAKAVIPVECLVQKVAADTEIRDYQFYEGDTVSIATTGMFIDFGLDVAGLEFTGKGLPEGLAVGPGDGLVKGNLANGSASNAPYNIVITASDGQNNANGISMQFLLDVAENEKQPHSLNGSDLPVALSRLYRMNRESEKILAAGLINKSSGIAEEFSIQQIPLVGKNIPRGMEDFKAPTAQLFAPDRYIYLQVNAADSANDSNCSYDVRLAGQEELPDWIICSPDGLISIGCPRENRYIDLELIQTDDAGTELMFDIGVDTYVGKMVPVHRQPETPTEKQIRQLSVA